MEIDQRSRAQRLKTNRNDKPGRIYDHDGFEIKFERKYDWSELILPEQTIKEIKKNTVEFLAKHDGYRRLGIKRNRYLLCVGDKGNGKTLCAKILATTGLYTTFWLNPSFIPQFNRLAIFLETVKRASSILTPTLVVIEDFDLFFEEKASLSETTEEMLGVWESLKDFDHNLTLIGTTRHPGIVENALASRLPLFDGKIDFTYPSMQLRTRFFEAVSRNILFDKDVSPKQYISNTAGFSCYDMITLISNAVKLSIDDGKRDSRWRIIVEKEHLDKSMSLLKDHRSKEVSR